MTRDYPPTIALLADAGPTLAALAERIRPDRKPDSARIAAIRTSNTTDIPPLEQKHIAVLNTVRAALPEDGQGSPT